MLSLMAMPIFPRVLRRSHKILNARLDHEPRCCAPQQGGGGPGRLNDRKTLSGLAFFIPLRVKEGGHVLWPL